MKHGLSSREEEHANQEQEQPHASMVLLAQAGGFVEDERYAKVGPKEKQEWQQQSEHEVPQRELVEDPKDVGTEQHGHQNQTLCA